MEQAADQESYRGGAKADRYHLQAFHSTSALSAIMRLN
jgi:hypothetical protein